MLERKISIIIPIYNADAYLRQCLNSIVEQDYLNYEVWMINDGSTDNSATICEEYASKYCNFKIQYTANKGVSNARNIGIEHASGYNITFIDADDYVSPDYLTLLSAGDDDLSICGCTILQENKDPQQEIINLINTSDNITSDKKALNTILNHHLVRPVWGKLFKRSIIFDNNIRFDPTVRLGEDTLFVLMYLSHAKTAKIVTSPSYFYFRDSFKVNKFRNQPDDIIFVYSKLHLITKGLENSGFHPIELYYSNYKSLCNNFYSLLFLSGQYSYNERKTFFYKFKKVNPGCISRNFGIPSSFLDLIYQSLTTLNFYYSIDIFLMNYYRLVKWKNS